MRLAMGVRWAYSVDVRSQLSMQVAFSNRSSRSLRQERNRQTGQTLKQGSRFEEWSLDHKQNPYRSHENSSYTA